MRAFVVLNPAASGSEGRVRRSIESHFAEEDWTVDVYPTTGEERIADVVRREVEDPSACQLVVAAGGDGTVSGVAGGTARTGIPLGVVPLGTGNTFARELEIPLEAKAALELLTGENDVAEIDALTVGERFYVLNATIGLSGLMMRDTRRADKRRFGRLAYIWTGVGKLFGYQPHRFVLRIDGETRVVRASDVAIVNSGALGDPSLRWSPKVQLDDGRMDVLVLRARSVVDYLRLAASVVLRRHSEEPALRHHIAERRVSVDTPSDLPVQADGEYIGRPPVEVGVAPGVIRVIVPPRRRET